MTKAIQVYNDGREFDLHAAGETYDINWQTLRNRINEGQFRRKAHSDQQFVTPKEEKAIVQWISGVDMLRWPPNIARVRQMAIAFLRSHGVVHHTLG